LGSNDATAVLQSEKDEPEKSTHKNMEPSNEDTQKEFYFNFLKN